MKKRHFRFAAMALIIVSAVILAAMTLASSSTKVISTSTVRGASQLDSKSVSASQGVSSSGCSTPDDARLRAMIEAGFANKNSKEQEKAYRAKEAEYFNIIKRGAIKVAALLDCVSIDGVFLVYNFDVLQKKGDSSLGDYSIKLKGEPLFDILFTTPLTTAEDKINPVQVHPGSYWLTLRREEIESAEPISVTLPRLSSFDDLEKECGIAVAKSAKFPSSVKIVGVESRFTMMGGGLTDAHLKTGVTYAQVKQVRASAVRGMYLAFTALNSFGATLPFKIRCAKSSDGELTLGNATPR